MVSKLLVALGVCLLLFGVAIAPLGDGPGHDEPHSGTVGTVAILPAVPWAVVRGGLLAALALLEGALHPVISPFVGVR